MSEHRTVQPTLWHHWTIPLSPGRMAYLALPSRLLSAGEWDQMMITLDLFKPGLTPGCAVCGRPGESQHSEPGGDTFWLCAECEAACAEVADEGQYVSLEDASNGV